MGALAIEAGKAGIEAGQGALAMGLGMLTQKQQDRRQLKQQEKLNALQIKGQKEMGQFNQGLAMDMWEKTNYSAQRAQMEKAGLNVGLMYEGGGPGGTTQTPTGNVSGAQAPQGGNELGMAMQLGLQMAMQKAQIKLAEAQANKAQVEADKTAGIDTKEAETRIEQIKQMTTNAKTQNDIAEYDKELKQIETRIATASEGELIAQVSASTKKLMGEAQQATAQGKQAEETTQAIIEQIKKNSIEQNLRIVLQKANIEQVTAQTAETKQKIQKIATEIYMAYQQNAQEWQKLGLSSEQVKNQKEQIAINKVQQEFNTSLPMQIRQWIGIVGDVAEIGGNVVKMAGPTKGVK